MRIRSRVSTREWTSQPTTESWTHGSPSRAAAGPARSPARHRRAFPAPRGGCARTERRERASQRASPTCIPTCIPGPCGRLSPRTAGTRLRARPLPPVPRADAAHSGGLPAAVTREFAMIADRRLRLAKTAVFAAALVPLATLVVRVHRRARREPRGDHHPHHGGMDAASAARDSRDHSAAPPHGLDVARPSAPHGGAVRILLPGRSISRPTSCSTRRSIRRTSSRTSRIASTSPRASRRF